MGFRKRNAPRRPGPWMPATRESREAPLSAEREADLAADDLAELLAATNAKRVARGKRELSADDVQLRVHFETQQMRRSDSGD